MTLHLIEHTSSSYGPRTYANAASADVTIALAIDYSTAGERLTKKAAGDKYLALSLENDWVDNARMLYLHMKKYNCKSINVAGNGIYTLMSHSYTQEYINQIVYNILDIVNYHWGIDSVRSGGQTGVDIAGGVAGVALGLDTIMLFPKGFTQRHENGKDTVHSEQHIINKVDLYKEQLIMVN